MDIKDLNKSQLLLLAVLLSFITSIATGITTVTLMQQAPVSITTPINRIIKQTVENIVQIPGKNTTQTVVVKEEDLVVDAIAKNKSSVFSISRNLQDLNGETMESNVGVGFVVGSTGIIASDASSVPTQDTYYVKNGLGKFKASFMFTDKGVSFLKIGEPVDPTQKAVTTFTAVTAGDMDKTKVGQKILVIGNTISSFIFDGDQDIKISVTKSIAGGLVLNLDGEALGIALFGEGKSFLPIKTVLDTLATQPAP